MKETAQDNRDKLWTPPFVQAMMVGFVLTLCNQTHITTLPLYAQEIGGNKAVAGLIMGVFTVSALIFRPVAGKLCDKVGRKFTLVAGICIFAAMSLTYPFTHVIWLLLLFRFIHGIGFSAQSTAVGTAISDVLPPGRLVEGIGYHGVAITLSTAIGPAVGLYLVVHSSYETLYLLVFLVSVVALVLALLLNYENEAKAHRQKGSLLYAPAGEELPKAFGEKDFFRTAAVMFFCAMALASMTIFLPTYAFSLGIEDVGLFFTVYALVLMVTRPAVGKLTNRFGVPPVIVPGILCLLGSFIAMIWAGSLRAFLVIGVFLGLGYGCVQPILNALTINFSTRHNRGLANAVFFASLDAGYGTGSILWGIIAEWVGFWAIYLAAAVCIVIALVLYLLLLPGDYTVLGASP